jgi:hypothetical protein
MTCNRSGCLATVTYLMVLRTNLLFSTNAVVSSYRLKRSWRIRMLVCWPMQQQWTFPAFPNSWPGSESVAKNDHLSGKDAGGHAQLPSRAPGRCGHIAPCGSFVCVFFSRLCRLCCSQSKRLAICHQAWHALRTRSSSQNSPRVPHRDLHDRLHDTCPVIWNWMGFSQGTNFRNLLRLQYVLFYPTCKNQHGVNG